MAKVDTLRRLLNAAMKEMLQAYGLAEKALQAAIALIKEYNEQVACYNTAHEAAGRPALYQPLLTARVVVGDDSELSQVKAQVESLQEKLNGAREFLQDTADNFDDNAPDALQKLLEAFAELEEKLEA